VRILCVGNMYPPHHLGGYELVWRSAVEHLRERGHAVRVLTSNHRERVAADDAAVTTDTDAHRELRWYWHDHRFPRIGLRARIALERANARTLERQLDEHRPDVVAWWAMGGMSLSLVERVRRAGLPAVAFVNDDWLIYAPRTDAWLRFAGRRAVPRGALERLTGLPARFDPATSFDTVVFASDAVRDEALQHWPLRRFEVAYGGIDPIFLRAEAAREWSWRLLYVGRIDPRKGIDTALEALALLPDAATLMVVGGGDREHLEALFALAQRLGVADRVEFAGQRAQAELPATYAAADAVVFPVRWQEPWGLVPLEAMGSGRPVVATGTGGSSEYLRDGVNCLLFAAGDAEALADRVRRLHAEPALRTALTAAGVETAREHTHAAFNARVEAVLAEAVVARQRASAAAITMTLR
jgi:glycosyltransferase involved in cell wall biosynthesis